MQVVDTDHQGHVLLGEARYQPYQTMDRGERRVRPGRALGRVAEDGCGQARRAGEQPLAVGARNRRQDQLAREPEADRGVEGRPGCSEQASVMRHRHRACLRKKGRLADARLALDQHSRTSAFRGGG